MGLAGHTNSAMSTFFLLLPHYPLTQHHTCSCTCVCFAQISSIISSPWVCCTCQIFGTLYLPVPLPFIYCSIYILSTLSSLATKANTEVSQNQRSHLKIILWAELLSFLLLCLHLNITLQQVFKKCLKIIPRL